MTELGGDLFLSAVSHFPLWKIATRGIGSSYQCVDQDGIDYSGGQKNDRDPAVPIRNPDIETDRKKG